MLGQLLAAQFELERSIAEAVRNGASPSQAEAELRNLTQLQRQVGSAGPAALVALRADIASAVTQASNVTDKVRGSAKDAAETASNIADLASASREQVNTIMAEMHRFDPYLQFSNAEEEAEYRRREAERRAYIENEQRKGTPEGDLNAAGGAVGQMVDAGAHGATNSPEFQQKWDALLKSTDALRAQVIREGGDVTKFDEKLRDDLRQIMKSKGLSDAEIDARFAAHPDNPLEAAKAYIQSENDLAHVGRLSERNANYEFIRQSSLKESGGPDAEILAMVTGMQTTVVGGSDHSLVDDPAHGISGNIAASPTTRSV